MTDKPFRFGSVVAEFSPDHTYMMETGTEEHARFLGAAVHDRIYVPGAYPMPLAIRRLLKKSDIHGVVITGCVIGGAMDHDQIVVQHAAWKILDFSFEFHNLCCVLHSILYGENCIEWGTRAIESTVMMARRFEG